MSLNRADPRFVLPFPARNAAVLGTNSGWVDGLQRAGIDVLDRPRRGVDLVVATRARIDEAIALEPAAIIVDGDAGRRLRDGGFTAHRLLARPRREAPAILLPLDQRRPSEYAIGAWSVVDRRWKRVRRDVARVVVPRAWPVLPHVVTAAAHSSAPPYLVAAARDHGIPDDVEWVLTLGKGDELSRNVFHLFPPGSNVPSWVLKFARVPGYREPFDRDERGLAAVASADGIVAARAPRLLARLRVDGIEASIETAAVGRRLREILVEPGGRDRKLRLIESIAAWIVELGRATLRPPAAVGAELARLREDVLPRYRALGVGDELLRAVGDLPAVLQHNDLGSWNVVVDGDEFVVLDWESAREAGLPLWDTVYFLADALALVDGASVGSTRHEHTARLFRGELPSSTLLFRVVGQAVEAFGIPPEAVGPVVVLCWMHHSQSPVQRAVRLEKHASGAAQAMHGTERNADAWLSDPALATTWPAWGRHFVD
jgi:Phosphotransferase enzyme family